MRETAELVLFLFLAFVWCANSDQGEENKYYLLCFVRIKQRVKLGSLGLRRSVQHWGFCSIVCWMKESLYGSRQYDK